MANQSGMSLRDIQQAVHYIAAVLSAVPVSDRPGPELVDRRETFEQLLLAAFALRIVDRVTYDKLVAGEVSVFDAAATLRSKLISNEIGDPHPGTI